MTNGNTRGAWLVSAVLAFTSAGCQTANDSTGADDAEERSDPPGELTEGGWPDLADGVEVAPGTTRFSIASGRSIPVEVILERSSPGPWANEGVRKLSTSEFVALDIDGPSTDYTEPSVGMFRVDAHDTYQTVVVANQNRGASANDIDFACFKNAYANKCEFSLGGSLDGGLDKSVATDWNGTNELYWSELQIPSSGNPDSITLNKTFDACGSGTGCTSPTISRCTWDVGQFWDQPTLIDMPQSENMWLVANQIGATSTKLIVARFPDNSCGTLTFWENNCSAFSGDSMVSSDAVAVDDEIWIVTRNLTERKIRFVRFDTDAESWSCGSITTIGRPNILPTYSAEGCGSACGLSEVMPNIANGCKLASPRVRIDVASRSGSPDAVASVLSAGSGSCSDDSEMWVYRSDNGSGGSWARTLVTGCKSTAHADVAFARDQTSASSSSSRVLVQTLYESGSSGGGRSGLRPTEWTSTNSGESFSGVFYASTQTSFPQVNNTADCYWGDYAEVYHDSEHNTSFYTWGDGDTDGSSVWTIHARGTTP